MNELNILWSEQLPSSLLDDDILDRLTSSLSLRFYGLATLGPSTVAHRFYPFEDGRLLLRLARDEDADAYVLELVAAERSSVPSEIVNSIRSDVRNALAPLDSDALFVGRVEKDIDDILRSDQDPKDLLENLAPRFEVGDRVVYPHHGAGLVTKREVKSMFGEKREYLTINILHNNMTVMVPHESASVAGLRRVMDEETVRQVMLVLEADADENCRGRRDFLQSRDADDAAPGHIYAVAKLVRDLTVLDHERGLAHGEKQLLTRARKTLVFELMYALELGEDATEHVITRTIAARWEQTLVDV